MPGCSPGRLDGTCVYNLHGESAPIAEVVSLRRLGRPRRGGSATWRSRCPFPQRWPITATSRTLGRSPAPASGPGSGRSLRSSPDSGGKGWHTRRTDRTAPPSPGRGRRPSRSRAGRRRILSRTTIVLASDSPVTGQTKEARVGRSPTLNTGLFGPLLDLWFRLSRELGVLPGADHSTRGQKEKPARGDRGGPLRAS